MGLTPFKPVLRQSPPLSYIHCKFEQPSNHVLLLALPALIYQRTKTHSFTNDKLKQDRCKIGGSSNQGMVGKEQAAFINLVDPKHIGFNIKLFTIHKYIWIMNIENDQ